MPDPKLAPALFQLRQQVNARWSNRSKNSDGWIGDIAHAKRKSDHNPNKKGLVTALDLTHDPKNGFDSYKFADVLLQEQDPRLEYLISNGAIGSGPRGTMPGVWRRYTGTNKHDHHVHISVDDVKGYPEDVQPWMLDDVPNKPSLKALPALPVLRKGSIGSEVVRLQRLLKVDDDGDFGPKTERAVILYQQRKGLLVDGRAGPQVWKSLGVIKL